MRIILSILSACAAVVLLVSWAAPASIGPENTPAAQSSETATPDEELLLAEAEFLTGRLVKHVFDGTIQDGISDINTAMEQDPGIPLRLPFILTLDLDDAGLYAGFGQYSEDGNYLYVSKENAEALVRRVLGLEELPESAFECQEYHRELQRFEYPIGVGLLDINSYADLTCTIDPATQTVHARFTLTDSGLYELQDKIYGPYEMIFSILSDGETPRLCFRSVLPADA